MLLITERCVSRIHYVFVPPRFFFFRNPQYNSIKAAVIHPVRACLNFLFIYSRTRDSFLREILLSHVVHNPASARMGERGKCISPGDAVGVRRGEMIFAVMASARSYNRLSHIS